MGCGSFWLKEECSSVGVSPWIRLISEILFELPKIFRPPTEDEFLEVPFIPFRGENENCSDNPFHHGASGGGTLRRADRPDSCHA
jgi:hypothetical protein